MLLRSIKSIQIKYDCSAEFQFLDNILQDSEYTVQYSIFVLHSTFGVLRNIVEELKCQDCVWYNILIV